MSELQEGDGARDLDLEMEPADDAEHAAVEPPRGTVHGRVLGRPARGDAWCGRVLAMRKGTGPGDAVNMHVERGCPVPDPGFPLAGGSLAADGSFSFPVPARDVALVLEATGTPPSSAGPVSVGDGESVEVVFDPAATGAIEGRVEPFDAGAAGNVWVVAFLACGFTRATRCDAGGRFAIRGLAPGRYGLHAGHEAMNARREYLVSTFHIDDHEHPAEPFIDAVIADVVAGATVADLRLALR